MNPISLPSFKCLPMLCIPRMFAVSPILQEGKASGGS